MANPQGIAALTQYGQGYAPLSVPSTPEFRSGLEGIPGINSGPFGMAVQLAGGPMIQELMGRVGMVPMGIGTDQNAYDTMRKMQFTQLQSRAARMAAEADEASFFRTFQGMAALTGTPFGAEQRRAAHSLAGGLTIAAPMLAQMAPEILDSMAGRRGSGTVLAREMASTGRYRLDPVTGRLGMTAESVSGTTRNVMDDLFSDENISSMYGLTAGRSGQLFTELSRRGMLGTSASERGYGGFRAGDARGDFMRVRDSLTPEAFDSVKASATRMGIDLTKGVSKLSGEDLDKLASIDEVSAKLRAFDANRVKRSLQQYSKTVAAMRDIFGDMGRPDAPMNELLQALDALTAGGSATMSPERMAQAARNTYNLGKQSGIGIDQIMMIQHHAGVRAQALGLESNFAVSATQGGLAFGHAYTAQGRGAFPAWGAMNNDQIQQLDVNARTQAAASNAANRQNVAMRFRDTLGGFDKGTDAELLTAAIARGQSRFTDSTGKERSTNLSDQEFVRVLTSTGKVSENDVRSALLERDTNREYGDKYNTASIVRRQQLTDELLPFVGNQMQATLTSRLQEQMRLADPKLKASEAYTQASQIAAKISQASVAEIFKLSDEEMASPQQRNAAIAKILDAELTKTGGLNLKGAERENFLKMTSELFYGNANRAIQGSSYSAHGNLINMHKLHNAQTLDEAARMEMRAGLTSDIQTALAPLGQGSLLSKAIDAIQGVKPGDNDALLRVLSETFGGMKKEDINKGLLGIASDISEKRTKLEGLARSIEHANPQERSKLVEEANALLKGLNEGAKKLSDFGERYGLSADEALGDVSRAIEGDSRLGRTRDAVRGIRTGTAGHVAAEDIARVMADPGTLTKQEAGQVLVARRMIDLDRLAADPSTASAEAQAGLQALLKSIAADPKLAGLPEAERRALAISQLRNNATNLSNAQSQTVINSLVTAPTLQSEGEARALLRFRRRDHGNEPTKAEIDAVMRDYPGISREDAANLAASRMYGSHTGVSAQSIRENMKDKSWQSEAAGYRAAFDKQEVDRITVTDEQRAEFLKGNEITAKMIAAFKAKNAGYSDEGARNEIANQMILRNRDAAERKRFNDMWGSQDGARFRSDANNRMQAVDNAALGLIHSPASIQRFGTRAVDMSRTLEEEQAKLRDLAVIHSGGDLARLFARDYDVGSATDAEREQRARIDAAVKSAMTKTAEIMHELDVSKGKEGPQYDPDTEARRILGFKPGQVLKPEEEAKLKEAKDKLPEYLKKYQQQMSAEAGRSPTQQVRELYKAYGLQMSENESLNNTQQFLAQQLLSPSGQGQMQRMIRTQSTLSEFAGQGSFIKDKTAAGKNLGINVMLDEYAASKADPDKLKAFQKKLGLQFEGDALSKDSEKRWEMFQQAETLQRQFDFSKLGAGRSLTTDKDVLDTFKTAMQGGVKTGGAPGAPGDGRTGPIPIVGHLTGTFKIEGNNVSMVSTAGGNRNYSPNLGW